MYYVVRSRRVGPSVLGNRIPEGFAMPIITKLCSGSTTRLKAQYAWYQGCRHKAEKAARWTTRRHKTTRKKRPHPRTCSSTVALAGRSTTPGRTRSPYCTKEVPIGVANRASIDSPNYVPGPDPHSTPNARSDGSSASTKIPLQGHPDRETRQ